MEKETETEKRGAIEKGRKGEEGEEREKGEKGEKREREERDERDEFKGRDGRRERAEREEIKEINIRERAEKAEKEINRREIKEKEINRGEIKEKEEREERENRNKLDTGYLVRVQPFSLVPNIDEDCDKEAEESAEKIYCLEKEINYVNKKLQSMTYNLALKEKENTILKTTLEQLEEKAKNRDSIGKLEGCVCSRNCSIF